jgi:hypothetical protein
MDATENLPVGPARQCVANVDDHFSHVGGWDRDEGIGGPVLNL